MNKNSIKSHESSNSIIYLVKEKSDRGALFDDLIKCIDTGLMYTEKEVATIVKQVMLA